MSLSIDIQTQLGQFNFCLKASFSSSAITGIFGPSGCGKSSLLKVLAGFIQSPGARVQWQQQDWQRGQSFTPIEQRRIGFMSQDSDLFPHLNVAQNINYGLKRLSKPQQSLMKQRRQELIELLNIEALMPRRVGSLSGGERQRVAMVRALLSDPQLLLMDEPLSAIDEASKPDILNAIVSLNRRYSIGILYVSHSFDEISYIADELFLISREQHSAVMPIDQALLHYPNHPALKGPICILNAVAEATPAGEGYKAMSWAGQSLKVGLACTQRLRLRANDIVIYKDKPQPSSALNLLCAQITDIDLQREQGRCLLKLDIQQESLLASITPYSLGEMQLKVGEKVYLQVKASSFW